MTDRQLLEAAARAAGMRGYVPSEELEGWICIRPPDEKCPFPAVWAPLADDGDALRLAVKLNIDLFTCAMDSGSEPATAATWMQDGETEAAVEPHDSDPYAATRRAIVRAAAAMAERGE